MASLGPTKRDKAILGPEKMAEIEKRVRDENLERLRREISKENDKRVRVVIEEQTETLRKEIREELQEEQRKALPTPQERARAKEVLRELELESRVLAHTASVDADEAQLRYRGRRRASWTVLLALLLGFLPTLCYLHMRGHSYETFMFWATAGSMALAFIMAIINHDHVLTKYDVRFKNGRSFSADYRQVAVLARTKRMMEVDSALYKYELTNGVNEVRSQVTQLHDRYQPSANQIEAARHLVRDSILEHMDPEKLLRVEVDSAPFESERGEPESSSEPGRVRREA